MSDGATVLFCFQKVSSAMYEINRVKLFLEGDVVGSGELLDSK